MNDEGCELCNQKPLSYIWKGRDCGYDTFESTVAVTEEDSLTHVRIGAGPDGRIGCIGEGEVETDFYYFNYCPQCGRKLKDD